MNKTADIVRASLAKSNSPDGQTCHNCKFFYQHTPETTPSCRSHPPQLHMLPVKTLQGQGVQLSSVYPSVDARGWCGEYRDRMNEFAGH